MPGYLRGGCIVLDMQRKFTLVAYSHLCLGNNVTLLSPESSENPLEAIGLSML